MRNSITMRNNTRKSLEVVKSNQILLGRKEEKKKTLVDLENREDARSGCEN